MKHYGALPPWQGESELGRWLQGEQLWDGDFVWTWRPPRFRPDTFGSLMDIYLAPIIAAYNQESLLLRALEEDTSTSTSPAPTQARE